MSGPQGRGARSARGAAAVRRGVDVAAAAGGLAALAPLLGWVTYRVSQELGRPVLFRQERAGRDGRPFTLYKFRSMLEQDEVTPRSDDERLTAYGRRLRASSLDELPQLVNVLRGEMALVGPRPLPVAYVERYDARQRRRLEVRPGITGWAQVNGRNALDWPERLELDVWYVENRSLRLDLRILALTVRAVLSREGVSGDGVVTMTEFLGQGASTTRPPT